MEFSEQLAQAPEAVLVIAGIEVEGYLVIKGIILREFRGMMT